MLKNEDPKVRETKEWTLMFFFASDNPLAISIVSQLKAIKAAGFHQKANVILQFDPYTEGTPTHIFDVNVINKAKHKEVEHNIGFDGEPFVPNLIEDRLWRREQGQDSDELIRDMLIKVLAANHIEYTAPEAPELNGTSPAADANSTADANTAASVVEVSGSNGGAKFYVDAPNLASTTSKGAKADASGGMPDENGANGKPKRRRRRKRQEPDPHHSLNEFLNFCRKFYPARHYMLFILGHGVVVGNDIFLYDEHAETHSITLGEMGDTLRFFREQLDKKKETFELVSFHSCSVSSLEVAYELHDTANYFLASEGPMFVGSWPYRQILMQIFKDLKENPTEKEIRNTIGDIFSFCVQNNADFLLAGYSYQLTLCDLRRLASLNEALQKLSNALATSLADPASTFIILYSHWKAQSFFQEMYTDLYDFCFCIIDRCERIEAAKGTISVPLKAIWDACKAVRQVLEKPTGPKDKRHDTAFVLASEFAGPAYQYSHGLSVYFPWSQPSEDSDIMGQYDDYTFHQNFHSKPEEQGPPRKSWKDFLEAYFSATQRVSKGTELFWELSGDEKSAKFAALAESTPEQKLKEEIASIIFGGEGPLGGSLAKDDPRDRTGGDCSCPTFKNYPRDTRMRRIRRKKATKMPVSESLFGDFKVSVT